MGDDNDKKDVKDATKACGEDESAPGEQQVGHLREAGRNIQRAAGAGLRREFQDDFMQLRINEQQRQYTFNIMRDFVFLGIFLYYFFFRDILGVRNLMFHFIYTGLTGKIYNETEIQEATKILLGTNDETHGHDNDSAIAIVLSDVDSDIEEVLVPMQKIIKPQPNCTRMEILNMFVQDYVNKSRLEVWNRQQKDQRVNRSDMVLPIILFLMLASLAATIWEVVQVRFVTGSSTSRDGMVKNKKHSLSRKCSLADLTVLRHDRKELRRKESGMAIHEDHGLGAGGVHGSAGMAGGPAGSSTLYNSTSATTQTANHPNTNLGHLQPLQIDSNQRNFNLMHTQLSLDSSILRISPLTRWDSVDKSSASSLPGVSRNNSVGSVKNQVQQALSFDLSMVSKYHSNPLGRIGHKSNVGHVQGVSEVFGGNVRQKRAFKIIRR